MMSWLGAMSDHRQVTEGRDALYHARESERDRSFLRRFLDEKLIRKLGMFEYASKKGDYVDLKALMNLVICLSACPQDILPINSNRPRNAHFQVLG